MKTILHLVVLGTAAALLLTGCESNDPTDHDVPPGKGSIVVDNNSGDDIAVYLNGAREKNVDAYEDKAIDLEPGVYRVILDQRSGTRSFHEDVDVVEGRRSIMDVTTRAFDSEYDVHIYFD